MLSLAIFVWDMSLLVETSVSFCKATDNVVQRSSTRREDDDATRLQHLYNSSLDKQMFQRMNRIILHTQVNKILGD